MNGSEAVEILLVEDNPNDARLTQRALHKLNLVNRLQWVKDGAEAIEWLRCTGAWARRNCAEKPKLVLLDLKLPKLSGVEVLREIKADERLHLIPVVILTSSTEDRDVRECYALGANSYIVKPVNASNFVETVSSVGLYWTLTNVAPR